MLDIFFFLLTVWVCSSILTAGAVRAERVKILQELQQLQERSRQQQIDSLYGRDHKDDV
jgi:hypothetical protein